jgi:hypothetical protein
MADPASRDAMPMRSRAPRHPSAVARVRATRWLAAERGDQAAHAARRHAPEAVVGRRPFARRADEAGGLGDSLPHRPAARYATVAPVEARRLVKKLALHSTPQHASGLQRAESAQCMVRRPCLARRLPHDAPLTRELPADEKRRQAAHATMPWRSTVPQARRQVPRLSPAMAP